MDDRPTLIHLRLDLRLTAGQRDQLRPALLRARSAELGEVRRRHVRLTAGYGDDTNRAVMDDEGDRAQARHDALEAVLEALSRVDDPDAGPDTRRRAPTGRSEPR